MTSYMIRSMGGLQMTSGPQLAQLVAPTVRLNKSKANKQGVCFEIGGQGDMNTMPTGCSANETSTRPPPKTPMPLRGGPSLKKTTRRPPNKYPISTFLLKRANEPLWNLTFNSLSSFGKIA